MTTRCCPTRGHAGSRRGARAVAHVRPRGVRVERRGLDRTTARGGGGLRAARRHLHARGHPRRGARPARPPASIGVDLVEVMPVNAFNGSHNWGYDGVLWHAVQETYGGPAAYQRFVDGCHAPASASSRTWSTTTSGRRGTTCRCFGPYLKAGRQHLGRAAQPRPGRFGGGAPLHPRQRADVARRLSRRRAAARRRARPRRLLRRAPAGGDRDRGGRAVRPPAPAADADRRVRPQRPASSSPRARPAATVSTRSGATTSTTPSMSR